MKKIKRFFIDNNLNKGYKSKRSGPNTNNYCKSNSEISTKQKALLPEIEIMEEYENLHPGTLKIILDMAQKSQKHRHEMYILHTKNIARNKFFISIGMIILLMMLTFLIFMKLI